VTGRPPPGHAPVAGVVGAWIPPELAEEVARWLRWALDHRTPVVGLDRPPAELLVAAEVLERARLRQALAETMADVGHSEISGGRRPHTPPMGVTEAAERLGKSDRTVRRWCKEGKLDAVESGGVWLIQEGGAGDGA